MITQIIGNLGIWGLIIGIILIILGLVLSWKLIVAVIGIILLLIGWELVSVFLRGGI